MSIVRVRPGVLEGSVRAPPSKSYTHRELVASYFCDGRSELVHPLRSTDTVATQRGLVRLGATVRRAGDSWIVEPPTPKDVLRTRTTTVDCGESGTTLRFLTAVAATRSYPVRLCGRPQLTRRPIGGLIEFLRGAGAEVRLPSGSRRLPYTVHGPIGPVRGEVDASESSQFLSALLLTLPSLDGVSRVKPVGPAVSEPYVAATRDVLSGRGVNWAVSGRSYRIEGPARFRPRRVVLPGDASSAAYLWAGAGVTRGTVRVTGIPLRRPQADLKILEILRRMGARVQRHGNGATVSGRGLRGISVELTDSPDLLPLVGVLAGFAQGPSRLRGAGHAAFKESDRRSTTAALIRAMGGRTRTLAQRLEVSPGVLPTAVTLRGARDHRIVMSAAIASLGADGPSTIENASSVQKSFPGFWAAIRELAGDVTRVRP